ncbi:hypothetical protein EPIB1_1940 [Tritonibacter mobilis]|nr:hypothetical protein EPIB1_1940 [Tritonibacter mobilis]
MDIGTTLYSLWRTGLAQMDVAPLMGAKIETSNIIVDDG